MFDYLHVVYTKINLFFRKEKMVFIFFVIKKKFLQNKVLQNILVDGR